MKLSDTASKEDEGVGQGGNQEQFRGMGFPNMNYLDPDAKG